MQCANRTRSEFVRLVHRSINRLDLFVTKRYTIDCDHNSGTSGCHDNRIHIISLPKWEDFGNKSDDCFPFRDKARKHIWPTSDGRPSIGCHAFVLWLRSTCIWNLRRMTLRVFSCRGLPLLRSTCCWWACNDFGYRKTWSLATNCCRKRTDLVGRNA